MNSPWSPLLLGTMGRTNWITFLPHIWGQCHSSIWVPEGAMRVQRRMFRPPCLKWWMITWNVLYLFEYCPIVTCQDGNNVGKTRLIHIVSDVRYHQCSQYHTLSFFWLHPFAIIITSARRLCFYLCWFVHLSVHKIMQNPKKWSLWDLQGRS